MAIEFDASSQKACGSTAVTSISWSHTVTPGIGNTYLFGGFCLRDSDGQKGLSMTFNGVGMSLIRWYNPVSSVVAELWGMLNPPAGTYTIVATVNGSAARIACGAVSLRGVDQASPYGTNQVAQGNTANPLVSISVAATQWGIDVVAFKKDKTNTLSPNTGQTQRVLVASGAGAPGTASDVTCAISTRPGAFSSMGWTGSIADNWSIIALPINAAEILPSKAQAVWM